jgi:hypothetical protein
MYKNGIKVYGAPQPIDEDPYLTFTNIATFSIQTPGSNLEYSYDLSTWTAYESESTINGNSAGVLFVRGKSATNQIKTGSGNNRGIVVTSFNGTSEIIVKGNLMSLIDYDNPTGANVTLGSYAFTYMFAGRDGGNNVELDFSEMTIGSPTTIYGSNVFDRAFNNTVMTATHDDLLPGPTILGIATGSNTFANAFRFSGGRGSRNGARVKMDILIDSANADNTFRLSFYMEDRYANNDALDLRTMTVRSTYDRAIPAVYASMFGADWSSSTPKLVYPPDTLSGNPGDNGYSMFEGRQGALLWLPKFDFTNMNTSNINAGSGNFSLNEEPTETATHKYTLPFNQTAAVDINIPNFLKGINGTRPENGDSLVIAAGKRAVFYTEHDYGIDDRVEP